MLVQPISLFAALTLLLTAPARADAPDIVDAKAEKRGESGFVAQIG